MRYSQYFIQVRTQDVISFAELTKVWIEILQGKASAERCYKKYIESAEKENIKNENQDFNSKNGGQVK